ncbi:bifunctional aldolase/short-chain dehydrogenase [Thermoplasma sp.]|uniref:bifunctional aldolase/short-chain dehydrogenase n=1 Tax=Thermoplasma sp. TaxID=1973142 RepID=UPI0012724B3A|nr:bifunctional aldolase/short-chain dehydrogenase [Thermoplasma sp.]KAA8923388.1 MAG: bifunctional aldolase/short-chain dehydrogenase [Thermoplasma sp.]
MQNRWAQTKFDSDIDEVVYASRLIGNEPDLVLHGGGNTSVKTTEKDHTGKTISVLRVKNSGSNLGTIDSRGFTGIRMDDALAAVNVDEMTDEAMVDYLKRSMVNPSEPSPSVETFLHAFLPYKFVMHSHADAILSITNTDLPADKIGEILGNVVVLPYIPPGFTLAKQVMKSFRKGIDGIVLRKHGLLTFGDTGKEAYDRHIDIVNRAEKFIKERASLEFFRNEIPALRYEEIAGYVPIIRGSVSRKRKKILYIDASDEASRIARTEKTREMCSYGPATPDMLIRTKYEFLYLDDLSKAGEYIEGYASKYAEEYRKYVKGFDMHDPYPAVIVVRGFGIITAGTSYREAKIIDDLAIHSFRVNANAAQISKHEFISKEEAYAMEYWPLEEAKLKKTTHRFLLGSIGLVTGAASGIGLEAMKKLAENECTVVGCDVDPSIKDRCREVEDQYGVRAIPFIVDLSSESQIMDMFRGIVNEVGGIDIVFNNAGILKSSKIVETSVEDLDKHYTIIGRASFITSREAMKIMISQGIGGNIVFNISKNLTHPGPEMVSYGSAKAFAAQVCHYVAKEGGRYGIRANIINPDKIFRGSKIWENGVLEARAKAKGQTVEEYVTGNLLRREVLPSHVANMLLAMVNEDIFGATTDAMVPVDGGIL